METAPTRRERFRRSLWSPGDGRIAIAQDGPEVLSIQLQEKKSRLVRIFIGNSATVFSRLMAITFAGLAVAYLFGESAWLAVLGAWRGVSSVAVTRFGPAKPQTPQPDVF